MLFALRDPAGIRPAFYFQNDEVIVLASERPAIQTAFDLNANDINELPPGHALIIKRNGNVSIEVCKHLPNQNNAPLNAFIFHVVRMKTSIKNANASVPL